MGWFTEVVDRNALKGADLSDVRVLFNHDANIVLGRSKAGTAGVFIDDIGLGYWANLPDSPNGKNVGVSVERGDVDQSSWAFYLSSDKWEIREGKDFRTILGVSRVVDVSAVTYPANPDTSAAKRSKESVEMAAEDVPCESPDMTETYNKLRRSLELRQALYTNKQTQTQ